MWGLRAESAFVLIASLTLCGASAQDARAFCRTRTCPAPLGFPTADACIPPDFGQYCASFDPPERALPIWWRNACVGYDVQKDASRQVPYPTAVQAVASAFSTWTGTQCSTRDGGTARVAIEVKDLGPVACDRVQYNSGQGNQNVILFHDDSWPYNDPDNTLALTTITFDANTGEIFDADMEINATVPLSLGDQVSPTGYDFASIVTHEAGHFLGLAHSGDPQATMYAQYTPGSSSKRSLTADDTTGLCSIYPPSGTRSVDTTVAPDGAVTEGACDPTPRHGFQSLCASTPRPAGGGCACALASRDERAGGRVASALAVSLSATAAARRRRRRGERNRTVDS